MEPYQDLLIQAQKQCRIAEHMLLTTYPVVKNPKMLPSILNRLYNALDYAITAILRFERNHNRIKGYEDSFESKLSLFSREIVKRYHLKPESAAFLQEIRRLVLEHKNTAVEFIRKDKLVMWEDGQPATLTPEIMQDFLSKTKLFIGGIHTKLRVNLSRTTP